MTDAEIIAENKPDSDWPTAILLRAGPGNIRVIGDNISTAVLQDFMHAYVWAATMMGLEPGHETHEPFLLATARLVGIRRRLLAAIGSCVNDCERLKLEEILTGAQQ